MPCPGAWVMLVLLRKLTFDKIKIERTFAKINDISKRSVAHREKPRGSGWDSGRS